MAFTKTTVTAQLDVVKTSQESFSVGIDFVNLLNGSTLSSTMSATIEILQQGDTNDGSAFAVGSLTKSGSIISVPISGGYDGGLYLVRVKNTLVNGAVREGCFVVRVHNQ